MAQVARRYDVNANLIFKWLRDPRFSSAPEPGVDFLPVTIAADPPAMKISRPPVPAAAELSVEITTPGGCRVRVEGGLMSPTSARSFGGWSDDPGSSIDEDLAGGRRN